MTRKRTTENMKNWPSIVQVLVMLISLIAGACVGYGVKSATLDQHGVDIQQNKLDIKQLKKDQEDEKTAVQKTLSDIATQQAVANTKLDLMSKQIESLLRTMENRKLDKVATSDTVSIQPRN